MVGLEERWSDLGERFWGMNDLLDFRVLVRYIRGRNGRVHVYMTVQYVFMAAGLLSSSLVQD